MKSIKKSFELNNKVAVITGGLGLLGLKHAEVIAEYGGIPILLDISTDNGFTKAEEISRTYNTKCEFKFCDITNESEIENVKDYLIHKYGSVDILVNNAAINPKVEGEGIKNTLRLENFSKYQWDLELGVGLTGAMLCSKIFGNEMAKINKGVILNIASDLGIIAPDQRIYKKKGIEEKNQSVKPVTYSVIKHGLIGLTKYLATYWADKGVRCNAICPGGVYIDQDPSFVKNIQKLIPLGRMAKIDEYKATIIYLVSDASSYMTGANLIIDGGRTII